MAFAPEPICNAELVLDGSEQLGLLLGIVAARVENRKDLRSIRERFQAQGSEIVVAMRTFMLARKMSEGNHQAHSVSDAWSRRLARL